MKTNAVNAMSALVSLSVAAAVHAQTTVIYVDDSAPTFGDGTSWSSAFRDLNVALAVATQFAGNVEVRVGAGLYVPDRVTGNRGASFRVSHFSPNSATTFSIVGSFGGFGAPNPDARDPDATPTVLSGDLEGNDSSAASSREDNSFCVVRIIDSDESLVLDGLTIRGGNSAGLVSPQDNGAGVTIDNSNQYLRTGPVFRNCRITDNRANIGAAGVFAYSHTLRLERCVFVDNLAEGGSFGALFVAAWSGAVISDSIFHGNQGTLGGAVGVYGGEVSIRRSSFTENTATYGGGVFVEYGSLVCENSLFAGNTAHGGGAVYIKSGATLVNCTLVDNRATYGGGILCAGFRADLRNCILWENRAQAGDAIASNDLDAEIRVLSSNVQGGAAGVYGFWKILDVDAKSIDTAPLFREPSSGEPDFRLMQASPCVDAGDPSVSIDGSVDLDGLPRFVGAGTPVPLPDMGCYELQTPDCPADYNGDGYTDGLDYDQFNNVFAVGDGRADVNRDGFIDGIDYDQFMIWFDSGC